MRRERLPVIVLSGRLGSGKTTLLNHLLGTGHGRLGVVVNDFGAVDVDALLVAGHVDAARSIVGGCLCCLADTSALDDALAALAAPRQGLDAVVVEASGLAEPRELARLVISSTAPGVRFGGVVEVVDAHAWVEQSRYGEPPVAPDHLAVASLVVVTKADLVGADALARLEREVRRLAPGRPVVRADHGAVDPALLYDVTTPGERHGQLSFADLLVERAREHGALAGAAADQAVAGAAGETDGHEPGDGDREGCGAPEHGHHEHGHHGTGPHRHAAYTSVSLQDPRPVHPARLLAWLEGRHPGMHRVKGTTWVDAPGQRDRWVVQAVGGWTAFERSPWPRGVERATTLVAIGVDLDEDAVRDDLGALLHDGDPLEAGAVTPLLRYCRR